MNRRDRLRVAAGAVLAGVAVAAALTASATHSWGNYHWARTANPFTIKLGDNLSSVWKPYLSTTSSDWSISGVLNTAIVAGATRPRTCKATTGRAEVCNSTYGNTGWLGVASIMITGGTHITAGTVKLNDTYFNTATYNTTPWRNLVMCQEVGHIFGLGHQDENFNNTPLGTCMDYSNDPIPNQHPNQHDYNQLEAIYAHVDSTTTVGQSTNLPAAMGLSFDKPSQWGRLVKRSRNAMHETYELDFGGGNRIVTHVLWAEFEGGPAHRERAMRE